MNWQKVVAKGWLILLALIALGVLFAQSTAVLLGTALIVGVVVTFIVTFWALGEVFGWGVYR